MKRRLAFLVLAAVLLAPPVSAQVVATCGDEVVQAANRDQFEYQSNGRTVRGLVYRPARPNGAGIVLLHGARGIGANAPMFDPHAIDLASRGYYVLMPNYYDAQPGSQTRTSRDVRIWRKAVSDGVRFLEAQPGAQTGRTVLWGFSLGGFLAGETAMETEVSGAVSVAGGLDVGEAGRERRSTPILLLHARRDAVISPSSTRAWRDNLVRRGASVDVQALEAEEHGLNPAAWCDVFARTRAFLDRNALPTDGAAPPA